MRQRLTLLLGIYVIMALSNAIVPVLPSFAETEIWLQSAIYSSYFFGAFLTVLPAGILSDRMGTVLLIRTGLGLTFVSGLLILIFPQALPVFIARSLEGIGAGLFVSSAFSWVNSQKDHISLSGYFIAALNLGLVTGLLGTGWLAETAGRLGGVLLFTGISVAPIILSVFLRETEIEKVVDADLRKIFPANFWLFVSAVILTGVTGVATALYPEFTGGTAATLSIQIGMMHTATIVTSIVASRLFLEPVPTIRLAALFMACAVVGIFFAPTVSYVAVLGGFAIIGGLAGFAINAQLAFLAESQTKQGTLMGLYNTSAYAGLTFLPFIAGLIAQLDLVPQVNRFFPAFLATAAITASVAITIGWCSCKRNVPGPEKEY